MNLVAVVQPGFVFACCPLCEGQHSDWQHEVFGMDLRPGWAPCFPKTKAWLTCKACGHVFAREWVASEELAALPPHDDVELPGPRVWEVQRNTWGRLALYVLSQVKVNAGASWLDVGCGSGALLAALSELQIAGRGLDVRERVVSEGKRLGLDIRRGSLERLPSDIGGPFDVVSLCDVLEHIPFPLDALHAAVDLLKPRGALLVSFPNRGSALWDALTEQGANPYWAEQEHWHNFDLATVMRLLGELHFHDVHVSFSERYRLGVDVLATGRAL